MSILTHFTRGKIRRISLGGMCIASLAIISQSVFADNGIRVISIESKNYATFFEDGGSFLGVDANSFHDKTNDSWIAHPNNGYNYLRGMTFFGNADLSVFNASGSLGIGTATPAAKLDVIGSVKITDGTEGVGKVLTSDASGLASWQTISGGGGGETVCPGSGTDNTCYGSGAMTSNTIGNSNTANGYNALYFNTTGSGNIALGYESLFSATGISFQTAVGYQALRNSTTGTGNSAFGYQALYSNTTGSNNVAIGSGSLRANTTGSDNMALGSYSLYSNTTGYGNMALGHSSLAYNTTGGGNIAIGSASLFSNTAGLVNLAIGHDSLWSNTTGAFNIALGPTTLYSNTTGFGNVAIGSLALYSNTIGTANTANGLGALYENIDGDGNTAMGGDALAKNTSGGYNTAMGVGSLYNNTIGVGNAAIGNEALYESTGSSFQTAIGTQALRNATTGTQNLAIGFQAGSGITTGSNNIAIGYDAQVPSGTSSNQLNIGNWIYGDGGNIGIGTSTGTAKLTIAGQVAITGGSPGAGKVLTSDASGLATWETPSGGGGGVTGGETSYIARWTGSTTLGTGSLYDTGTGVGIGTTNPDATLSVSGAVRSNSYYFYENSFPSGGGSGSGLLSLWNENGSDLYNANSGSVGIGTSSPVAKLDIAGNIKIADGTQSDGYVLTTNATGLASWQPVPEFILEGGQSGYMTRWINANTLGTGSLYDSPLGVGIGTDTPGYTLEVNGDIGATQFLYTSDRSMKKNIVPLENMLEKILTLRGYAFDWKTSGKSDMGLIAQEVELVFPELVSTHPQTRLKSVEYGNLVAPLIEALREQQQIIDRQTEKTERLESELALLRERLDRLESR